MLRRPVIPTTRATPAAASSTWMRISIQSMPLVEPTPSALAMNVPMNAATTPMTSVSQIGSVLLTRNDQTPEGADDQTDDQGGNDAGNRHGDSLP